MLRRTLCGLLSVVLTSGCSPTTSPELRTPPSRPLNVPRPPVPPAGAPAWKPLLAHRGADLPPPAERSAAAFSAAAQAASQAGVLDVAAYWWGEAHALEPSPELARAWTEARREAGIEMVATPLVPLIPLVPIVPIVPIEPIEAGLARALRAAVEAHAWHGVLALTGPALAAAPHHELYFWAGDALWQQGREVEARRMWSRARVLLHAADVPVWPEAYDKGRMKQLAWSRGGVAFARSHGGQKPRLEVWGDRLERPWRRWRVAQWPDHLAWTAGGTLLASAADRTLTLRDPTNGAVLASTIAHDDPIADLAAAESAPVLATSSATGEVKVWVWSTHPDADLALTPKHVFASKGGRPMLALDPSGTQLAVARPGQAIELVGLPTSEARALEWPGRGSTLLRFLDPSTLLVAHAGAVTRGTLAVGAPHKTIVPRERPGNDGSSREQCGHIEALASSSAGKIAGTCSQTHSKRLVVCDELFLKGDCQGDELHYVEHASFSPDGDRLAVIHQSGLLVQDLDTGRSSRVVRPSEDHLEIAGVGPGGATIAVQDRQNLAIWDTRTGIRLLERKRQLFLGFSPDGRSVVLRGERRQDVEVHALAGGPMLRLDTAGDMPTSIDFSTDGRRLAIATSEHIGVWDLSSGAEIWREATPEDATQVEFAAGDTLVYETQRGLHVRDAAGARPPSMLMRSDGIYTWTLAPDGSKLLVCADSGKARSVLIDVRTRRVRRRLPDLCGAVFTDPKTLLYGQDLSPTTLDLETGRRSPPIEDEVVLWGRDMQANGAVIVAPMFDRRGSLVVLTRAGKLLATLHPRANLSWFAATPTGAVDGDLLDVDTALGRGDAHQLYPAALAWDGAQVRGLLPRVFAGEAIAPPTPQ